MPIPAGAAPPEPGGGGRGLLNMGLFDLSMGGGALIFSSLL